MHPAIATRPLAFAAMFALALTAAGCGADSKAAANLPDDGTAIDQDGIRIDCSIEQFAPVDPPRAFRRGDVARVTLHISDTATGQPISGLHPGAWMMSRPNNSETPPDAEATKSIIRKLIAGGLEASSTNDLNSWFFATLNTDNTLTLIDPLLDFSRSRMKSIIELPCAGTDLALGDNHLLMFLTLPDRKEVAVVDTASMTLASSLQLGEHPVSLETQPVTSTIWVEDDKGPFAYAVDGRTGEPGIEVEVGAGGKLFAFDDQGQWTFVASRETGRILRVASKDGEITELAKLDTPLGGLAWSDTAEELYAVATDGSVEIVRTDGSRSTSSPLPAGCGPMWAVQGGRFLMCVESDNDRVHVIDAAVRSPARTVVTSKNPTQLVCSDQFAYVFCADSRQITLIPLSGLGSDQPIAAMQVGVGQKDPKEPIVGTGDLIIASPDRMSALLAAPEEKQIYYYAEGMNAPMGSYQNYSRVPQALAIVDRTMRELAPGVYSTIVPVDQLGTVDLYTYLAEPSQFFGRFEFHVEEDPEAIKAREALRPGVIAVACDEVPTLPVGRAGTFRFRLEADGTNEPVGGCEDVRVLVYAKYGNWQDRLPVTAETDGTYSVSLELPEKGEYRVRVQCPQHGLAYQLHRPIAIFASDDVEGAAANTQTTTTNETSKEGR